MKKFILVAAMTAIALPVVQHYSAVSNQQKVYKQRSTPRQVQKRKKDYQLIPGICVFVVS